jgi:hypothetical protein
MLNHAPVCARTSRHAIDSSSIAQLESQQHTTAAHSVAAIMRWAYPSSATAGELKKYRVIEQMNTAAMPHDR